MTSDLDNINVILATDCGSTTTKAILIEKIDGTYRQTYRGEAPTTVEKPFANVTIGVTNSVTEVGDQKQLKFDGEVEEPTETESAKETEMAGVASGEESNDDQ